MSYKWIAQMGELDQQGEVIRFRGKTYPPAQGTEEPIAQVGIFICDQEITDGVVTASVEFGGVTDQTVCDLIVGHDPDSRRQVDAGIGYFAMYVIREWLPPEGLGQGRWNNLSMRGDRSNLKPGIRCNLEARISGSRVTLCADGIEVASAVLPAPPTGKQVGLFFVGLDGTEIQVSDFQVRAEQRKAFVVMQFSDPYNQVYSDVIKLACEEFALKALRADEMYGPGIIIKDVVDQIERSQVVIADITPPNPNVYFEVGYALAVKKPIILLAARETPEARLPFDVSAFRVLFYENSIGGKAKLEEGLRKHLKEILGR